MIHPPLLNNPSFLWLTCSNRVSLQVKKIPLVDKVFMISV